MPSAQPDFVVRDAAIELMLETNAFTGDEYFEHITEGVARFFGVDCAYLTELGIDFDHADLVASHQHESVPYCGNLAASAICDAIMEHGSLIYPDGIRRDFRSDEHLAAIGAEAAVGLALQSGSGDAIGTIFLLHRRPLTEAAFIEAVLRELAPRIGAELERRQRELALQRSERRLRLLTDRASDVFFYVQVSPAVEVQYISSAVETLFELPAEAFYANPELLFSMRESDERHSFEEVLLSTSGEPLVARLRLPSGASRWVEYDDFAILNQQTVSGIGGRIRDVTRRVEAELAVAERDRYLEDLLLSIPDTLLLLRSDGDVLDYVAGEVDIGLGPPEEVKGRHIKDLMSPAIVGALERTIRTTARTRRVQHLQFDVPGPSPRLHDVRCLPFGDGALLLVLRDLTAEKWYAGEAQRQRLREELDDRVESTLGANAYGLTHRELAVLSLVVEGMADKQIADALGISTYTVNKHVGNVLGKMNAVSRTEAGVRAIKEGLLPRDSLKSSRSTLEA